MINLNSSNIITELLKSFSELNQPFIEYAKYDDVSLLHNVFAFVFNPFLKNALNQKDPKILKRIFNFLEIMAKSSDKEISNILATTILESLNPTQLKESLRYMEPKTKVIYKELEIYLKNIFT